MSEFIFGVTGRSGSGKTTFCTALAKTICAKHINVDIYCHNVIELYRNEIENILLTKFKFSPASNFLLYAATSFRKFLGELIFSDQEKYKDIVSLVWNQAKDTIQNDIDLNELVILDYILLPKTHFWKMCNRKILITCADKIRYKRILDRDNISLEYLYKREQASMDYSDVYFDVKMDTTND